jgi:ribonucleoside-diphosphate reductase beta chain
MMENIHSETYSLLIDTYVKDEKEKAVTFKAIENFPPLSQKSRMGIKMDRITQLCRTINRFCRR